MKQTLALVLAVVLLAVALPIGMLASADSLPYTYETHDDYVEITKYTGNDKALTVPAKIGGKPVQVIGERAFADNTKLVKVTLPDTLNVLDTEAFAGCSALEDVSIPHLSSLNGGVFRECVKLKKLILPQQIHYIFGDDNIYGCDSLTELKINGSAMFADLSGKGNCILNRDGSVLLMGCNYSEIPASVREIGRRAFAGCRVMKKMDLPDWLNSIGTEAFADCSGMEEFCVPNGGCSGGNIAEDAFIGCTGLQRITAKSDSEYRGSYYYAKGNCL